MDRDSCYNNHNNHNNHNNNNNNHILNTDSTHSPTQERTESDATHFRLRNDLHAVQHVTCLSCEQTFESTSLLEIYEHYGEREHTRYYSTCLYCQGKVHRYQRAQSERIEVYHHCLRWKRGEDK